MLAFPHPSPAASTTDMSISVPSSVPSPQVLTTLHSLVCQLQSLGLPPSLPIDQFGLDLYSALAQRVRALDGWQKETGERVKVMDLANLLFLSRFVVVREDPDWKDLVSNVAELVSLQPSRKARNMLADVAFFVSGCLRNGNDLDRALVCSETPSPALAPAHPDSSPPPAFLVGNTDSLNNSSAEGDLLAALVGAASSPGWWGGCQRSRRGCTKSTIWPAGRRPVAYDLMYMTR